MYVFGREWAIKFQEQNPSNISKVTFKLLFVFGLSPVRGYSYESSGLLFENSVGLVVLGKEHK